MWSRYDDEDDDILVVLKIGWHGMGWVVTDAVGEVMMTQCNTCLLPFPHYSKFHDEIMLRICGLCAGV